MWYGGAWKDTISQGVAVRLTAARSAVKKLYCAVPRWNGASARRGCQRMRLHACNAKRHAQLFSTMRCTGPRFCENQAELQMSPMDACGSAPLGTRVAQDCMGMFGWPCTLLVV